jgi:general stress protein YciG
MAQTKAGAKKAVFSIRDKYGDDFYKIIGAKGGKKTGNKGFALNRELAREAGRKGGIASSRAKKK